MDTIPADVVEATWKEMAAGSVADARKWADRMTKEQPFVLAYLLAVGERDFNPDEAQLLFYLGTVVWQIFDRSGQQLAKVSGDVLDRTEKNNAKMLEYLEGESETGFVEAVRGLLDGYNQVEVLRYVINALMEEPEEGCDIRGDNVGSMFVHLKTVIDCFDRTG
jgi:hypothetical protein